MYSLMNVGKNYFCHLLAEQILVEVMEPSTESVKWGLLRNTITPEVVRHILHEPLKRIRIFIETTGISSMDKDVLEAIYSITSDLLANDNEIYFMGFNEFVKKLLKGSLEQHGYTLSEQYSTGGFWYLSVSLPNQILNVLSGDRCSDILYEIHDDNLRILVADGPRGKALDMKRLIQDEEECILYYCYRLAERMVDEGLVSADPDQNSDIYMVAGNEPGYYVAFELSKILGISICDDMEIGMLSKEVRKYIIVRDVIHMFCELSRLTTLIEGEGATVIGSSCLIDINTGVGNRKNRVSLYTIDLEKGISYRLRLKKKEESNGI